MQPVKSGKNPQGAILTFNKVEDALGIPQMPPFHAQSKAISMQLMAVKVLPLFPIEGGLWTPTKFVEIFTWLKSKCLYSEFRANYSFSSI